MSNWITSKIEDVIDGLKASMNSLSSHVSKAETETKARVNTLEERVIELEKRLM